MTWVERETNGIIKEFEDYFDDWDEPEVITIL